MDRQAHEYAAAMAFAQQQQQQVNMQQQQQQFGFHSQSQQHHQQMHGSPFIPTHPSLQQYPYQHRMPQQHQLYAHPPHPILHLPQQQQSPSGYPPHIPPHLLRPPMMHLYDAAPPAAAPPTDPELHKRIDKLIEYSARNGPEFEALIREREQDNPAYSFLFGGEGHSYYRYKLWISTRSGPGFNPLFPSSSMPVMPPSQNPLLNPSAVNPPSLGAVAGGPVSMLQGPQSHQPSFHPYFEQHQQPLHSQAFLGQPLADYESSMKSFKGLSGPLPTDVAAELNAVLSNLTGTKESIKGAKLWFMQRSPFAPALSEALRDRIFSLDDSERQLHIIFLANDILFDSLQRRTTPQDLDNEALAFKPVLGSMLARIYNNPHNMDENQSRLEKILQFWASKEVYDQETIANLQKEMTGGLPLRFTSQKETPTGLDTATIAGQTSSEWQSERPKSAEETEKQRIPISAPPSQFLPTATPQFLPSQVASAMFPPMAQAPFPGALPPLNAAQATAQPSIPLVAASGLGDKAPPPYPLFPPGLIPGMVRKMQIGSGVPYSPMSPLDIPTVIPPSNIPPSEILERVGKFFKEIGEANPSSQGTVQPSEPSDDFEYDREPIVRKGGACIPPPPNLQVDPDETGTYADGSFEHKPGSVSSGRLGLGATANPNEVSQYDDVYSSYRKQRSTTYHSSMSARSSAR
ncbi:hypothetical protein HPP92_005549 [Vanilla planifolia]|uniref:Calcium homeostasis endoplasmic reticulum protein n=1 Tax=Vanilla planifolia TaxID=51239 RepID=A0A835RLK8_VANPL|nr:hypothetical protein HPP92_005549 [Vanilla planifolia]